MVSAIRPIIAANWKMNKTVGESLDFVNRLKHLMIGVSGRQVIVAPPFTALHAVGMNLGESEIRLAAQNVSEFDDGACTGEISARMLVDADCRYVIIGHSERRILFRESDEVIHAKVRVALKFDLQPIFCIGETEAERAAGRTFEVVEAQIRKGLHQMTAADVAHTVIAYEPVWAIGTGKTATPEQAEDAHVFIRHLLEGLYGKETAAQIPLLYGGSVKPENIGRLMALPNINGALVGGASLDVETFGKIIAF